MNPPPASPWIVWLVAVACGGAPSPAPPRPAAVGDVDTPTAVQSADGQTWARSAYVSTDEPRSQADASARGSGGAVEVYSAGDREAQPRQVFRGPHPPAWLALDDDGDRLAFVSSADDNGVAGLWLWRAGDARAHRVTNGGPRAPGRPPDGFVENPHRAPPWFDGAWLRWEAADGPHAVEVGP
jgi:hypothetical protein